MALKKSEKLILGVLGVVCLVGAYLFVFDTDASSGSPTLVHTQQEAVNVPRGVSLNEYLKATDDDSPEISERESEYEQLQYQLRLATLRAQIAEQDRVKDDADSAKKRAEVEIRQLEQQMENQRRLTEFETRSRQVQQEVAAANRVQTNQPVVQRETISTTTVDIDAEIARRIRQSVPKPENNSVLHHVTSNEATLTVDGQIRTLIVGNTAGGIRLVSTDASNASATIQGVASGDRVTLSMSTQTSRRFSEVAPIGSNNVSRTQSDRQQSGADTPAVFDYR